MESRHPNHPGDLSTEACAAECQREMGELRARAAAIELLQQAQIPFLVGGAYAYAVFTGIYRDTKDLDLFLRKRDALSALELLSDAGWHTERTDEIWIYKALKGEWLVDLLFSSANGLVEVDDTWFMAASKAEVLGSSTEIVAAEEMIWSKAFVMERERYDGADVAHLIKFCGAKLDWDRLLRRFGPHWEVLLSHLILYRYAYPGEREAVPTTVMRELIQRTLQPSEAGSGQGRLCRGPLLSRSNYLLDIREWGYRDARPSHAQRKGE